MYNYIVQSALSGYYLTYTDSTNEHSSTKQIGDATLFDDKTSAMVHARRIGWTDGIVLIEVVYV